MKTHTRRLRSPNLRAGAYRRWLGKHQAGAAHLGGAIHALKTSNYILAVVLAMSASLVHAQTPVCAAPGCNSVASDTANANTAIGTAALRNLTTGAGNTALGDYASFHSTTGLNDTASGAYALYSNTTGSFNTASGFEALFYNTTGKDNTASGNDAMVRNATGNDNTAIGFDALFNNTTGNDNTSSGANALFNNTTGNDNTSSGFNSLEANTTGASNSAFGDGALQSNVVGNENTATGAFSLFSNTSGNYNAASGFEALYANTTASHNTALGFRALYFTTTGDNNTAAGFRALVSNTTGRQDTALGADALHSNTTGLNNIAIGADAGYAVTGSNNIDIGSMGSAGESGVIRIGGPSQSAAYIAGISSTHLTGSAVYVTPTGQLGVQASSERYKTDIATMPDASAKLAQLRPVIFHYKSDPKGARQYGLIAEEVGKVYPELVISDESGKIQGVHYEELAPILLNEIQKQQRINAVQAAKIDAQAGQIAALSARADHADSQAAEIHDLKKWVLEMQSGILKQQSKDELVAQR